MLAACNYRWGRGEAAVGQALDALLAGDVSSHFAHYDGMVAQALGIVSSWL